jgi:hypothetical protein
MAKTETNMTVTFVKSRTRGSARPCLGSSSLATLPTWTTIRSRRSSLL